MIIYASYTRKTIAGHALGNCPHGRQVQPLVCYYATTYRLVVIVPLFSQSPIRFASCEICHDELEHPEPGRGVQNWSPELGIPSLASALEIPAHHLPSSPINRASNERNPTDGSH